MPTPPTFSAVDIIRLVGPRVFARAQGIDRANLVSDVAWDPAATTLSATVISDDDTSVRCVATTAQGLHGSARPLAATCTCPVGGECEHIAAMMLAASRQAAHQRTRSNHPDESSVADASIVGAADDWRQTLTDLTTPPAGDAQGRLGLQFAIRDVQATRADPAGIRLSTRPVAKSAAGNWVRGQLTWGSLPYSLHRLDAPPAQHAWFVQFAALHRVDRLSSLSTDGGWIDLDDFTSPLLWPLLSDAATLDIPFIIGKRTDGVLIGAEAQIVLDASARRNGTTELSATTIIDGKVVPPHAARPLGTHGVYTYSGDPVDQIRLAPLSGPIPDQLRRLLVGGSPIRVPPEAREEFTEDWLPSLNDQVRVISSDQTLPATARSSAQLTVIATFERQTGVGDDDRVSLRWRWRTAGVDEPAVFHGPLPDLSLLEGPGGGLDWFEDGSITGADVAAFSEETIPLLKTHGIHVDVRGDRADFTRLAEQPTIRLVTVPTNRTDWFDLSVVVQVQERDVPLPKLLKALAKGEKRLKLVDNSYLALHQPVFEDLKDLLEQARELTEWEPGQPIRISPAHVGLWSEFDQLADESEQDARWQQIAARLLGASAPEPTPLPPTVNADLRPYQHEGVSWLSFLISHRIGGVLADDMGLGKTVQTLASIAVRRAAAPDDPPVLVVAPTSVLSTWAGEAARFVPSLVTRTIRATDSARQSLAKTIEGTDIVITSYALLRLDSHRYRTHPWSILVLDEAQFVKNARSQTHQAASRVQAPVKIALTGTPMENGLTDLWALFSIVAPGLLSSSTRFAEEYVTPLRSDDLTGDARAALTHRLQRRIRPFMLRRTKGQVAAELPAKQEQVIRIPLSPEHLDLYERTLARERLKVLRSIDDIDRDRMIVLRSLTLLRMLALTPALVDDAHADVRSAKLDFLLDELEELAAAGRRALVFSQFTSYLGIVADALAAREIAYEYLDGSTHNRDAVVGRFRSGTAPAFLISLKAGGFGVTLTEADTVFVLDPWWNPAAENQAIDRVHRIGQTSPVSVVRLIAQDTIEEKVAALAARKATLFEAVIDGNAYFADKLTTEDIRELLG